jgi:hypothetical protein
LAISAVESGRAHALLSLPPYRELEQHPPANEGSKYGGPLRTSVKATARSVAPPKKPIQSINGGRFFAFRTRQQGARNGEPAFDAR